MTEQLTQKRLEEISISHDLDCGGYEYTAVDSEWQKILDEEPYRHTLCATIDADVFGGEVMGSSRDFFGFNIHSLRCPIILFDPCGVYCNPDTTSWPKELPDDAGYGPYTLIIQGWLAEYDSDCHCHGKLIEHTGAAGEYQEPFTVEQMQAIQEHHVRLLKEDTPVGVPLSFEHTGNYSDEPYPFCHRCDGDGHLMREGGLWVLYDQVEEEDEKDEEEED